MKKRESLKAEMMSCSVKKEFTHEGVTVLKFGAQYPQIRLERNSAAQTRINAHYLNTADSFFQYARKVLWEQAIEAQQEAQKQGYPFFAFEAQLSDALTMNEDCTLSTYFDRYQYTGGAHGLTFRSSDNWSLDSGRRISMGSLFPRGVDYRKLVCEQIIVLANQTMQQNPGIYFEEYKTLILEYFNPTSFNLTPEGLMVYYQQYEIAPYVTGIVVFEIDYEKLCIRPPGCRGF
ncbi:MAG: DUF3298 and DUF4163 domain-containing protein [Christensenellales bacterium]